VASCPTCRENRSLAHPPYGMVPLEIPNLLGADLSKDFTFCLPRSMCPTSQRTYTGVQVYVDRLSKRVLLLPCSSDIIAEGAADLYLQRGLPIFGMMRSLVSDRDPRFTSALWKQLCQVLRIKLKMSTLRHPQTDGQSEEAIRYLPIASYPNAHPVFNVSAFKPDPTRRADEWPRGPGLHVRVVDRIDLHRVRYRRSTRHVCHP
jgi:hypothetical protein